MTPETQAALVVAGATATGYGRRRDAVRAVSLVGDAPRYSDGRDADLIEVRDVDERRTRA